VARATAKASTARARAMRKMVEVLIVMAEIKEADRLAMTGSRDYTHRA
jgi:hypothetical protein